MSKKLSAAVAFALLVIVGPANSVSAQPCSILTAADVQKTTGTHVQSVPFMSKPGAGGKCANFATDNGRLYLGVSALASASDYATAVAAVPDAIYPQRQKLKGIGDEAILMKGAGGFMRYLVARKGGKGVILFPFGSQPSDEKLEALAKLALAH